MYYDIRCDKVNCECFKASSKNGFKGSKMSNASFKMFKLQVEIDNIIILL